MMSRSVQDASSGVVPPPAVSGAVDDDAVVGRGLHFSYGDSHVLQDVDLRVGVGEIVVLIGPSGCGKSTILNLIAGTIAPSAGSLTCSGVPIRGLNRRVTYLTQRDTLLPWRTALDNAALPLEIKHVARAERHRRAGEALARVGVDHASGRRLHELSGGMRSRVALARALLSESDIFLLDEPFAAIDALLRVKLQRLLIDVWESTRKTMIYVTHDLSEAICLGDRVIVMGANPGRVVLERSITTPHPRDPARFRTTTEAQQIYEELWTALDQ